MKIKLLLSLILIPLIVNNANGQLVKLTNIEQIKNSKIIVILTEDEDLNSHLKSAVENFWDFNEVVDYLSEDEAYAITKTNSNLLTLGIEAVKVRSSTIGKGFSSFRYVTEGLQIEIKKGENSKSLMNQFIPSLGENLEFADVFLSFGISTLNYTAGFMIENQLKNNMRLYNDYQKYSDASLKNSTLLITENWIHKKTTIEEIKETYDGAIEVTPFIDWKEAILEKKSGTAYSIVVPIPAGSAYMYMHYLIDCETGTVFGVARPKINVGLYTYSLTESNSGYIRKKNIKIYNDIIK